MTYDPLMKYILTLIALLFLFQVQETNAAELPGLSVTHISASAGSIPLGAQRIPMLHLNMKQSCDRDVHIRTITIHHTGMGDTSDILKIYALEKDTRLTRGTTVQKNTASAVLRFHPPLTVPACTSRMISIAMDLASDAAAGSEHAFTLKSTEDIQTDGSTTLSQGVQQSVLTAKPKSTGSVTFTLLPESSRNVLFGDDRTLLRFSLRATSHATIQLDAMTFTNDGSARGTDISQLVVKKREGRHVSDVSASLTGDQVRLVFSSPFLLERNETQIFTLSGNVRASRRKTIEFTVAEPSDIEVHDVTRR